MSLIIIYQKWPRALFICTSLLLLMLFFTVIPPVYGSGPTAVQERVKLISTSPDGLTIEVQVDDFDVAEITVAGTRYQQLNLADNSSTTPDIGKPELPIIGQFIAVPAGARASIEVVEKDQVVQPNYLIYPTQPPHPDQTTSTDPPFVIDPDFYQQDTLYPQEEVRMSPRQTLRDLKVVWLSIHPFQYNPARRELHFNRYMRLRITFTPDLTISDNGSRSPDTAFHNICQSLVLNCDSVEQPPAETRRPPSDTVGAEYLIISAPAFVDAAITLADWKNKRGIKTIIRTTQDTGATTTAIKNYLQTAYNTWSPKPTYVLFLGDVETIPVFYVHVHPEIEDYPQGHKAGTDLYYATMGGANDLLPDFHLGRLPVDTLAEANQVVNKIIAYETNPTTDSGFYNRVAIAAQFQDDNLDGIEDLRFTRTSEEVRNFLLSQGYQVQRIYEAASSVDPRWYNGGMAIPSELRKPGFTWDGDETDIANAVNNGVFILFHRDHGWRGGWVHPNFEIPNVNSLTNGAKTPVVFSINCESGFFDLETSGLTTYTDYDPGFSEKFLRLGSSGQRGAVGVFAATRVSWSWHNDTLIKGFYDSIWPDLIPNYNGINPSPAYRMGDTLTYGKYHYASEYGTSDIYAILTLELYHYLGDPTMEIWTAAPAPLTVSHTATANAEDTSFTVSVAQAGALVSIVQNGTILGTAISSGGSTTVPLFPPLSGGAAYVTVTRHNYRPYQGTVAVSSTPAAPAAPSSLAVTPVSQTQLDLTWTDNSSNENGFKIERSPNGLTWTQVATTTVNVTAYSDTGLTCNTPYYYRVRAYNDSGNSGYSNTAQATTMICPPAAPTNLAVTPASQTQLDLTWTDNSSNESGFKIERSPNGLTWTQVATTGANISTFSETGLTCDSIYYYRVRAYNSGGDSNFSNIAHAATIVCPPAAPDNLIVTPVSQTRLDLIWLDNSHNESGFKIERSADGLTNWAQIATVGPNITAYSNAGLSCNSTHFYRIRAYNVGGNSNYSNVAQAATVICPPVAPGNLTATVISQTEISLTWLDNSDNESGFRLEQSPDGVNDWTTRAIVDPNLTTYSDPGLSCNSVYYYRMYAFNDGGDSTSSNIISTITWPCSSENLENFHFYLPLIIKNVQ